MAVGLVRGGLSLMDSWLEDLPDITNPSVFSYAEKTRVYANDGTTLLAEFFLENRDPVTLSAISPLIIEATIATEDARFYEHNGVDPLGIARALVRNLQGGAIEGASTITQQLVRNTVLVDEATELSFKRKIREAQLAIEMEDRYSKDEILNRYLNMINYGDGCYGIEAAAQNYYSKTASEVTLNEAATLAGIPQSPTYLNPKANPEACLARRNIVLNRMLNTGHIDQATYDATIAEPLTLNPAPAGAADGICAYPYFTSYVRQLLLDEYGDITVFKGGLTVYTTLDPALQDKAAAACEAQYERMDDDLDVSLTSIDPKTGYILAMVGGKDYAADQFNLATQASRQAGSSFKTFTLVSAIEQGISPQTNIDCSSPLKIGEWRVENYGGASYGTRSIQSATAISSNTGFARLIQTVTPAAVVEVAHRMGIVSNLEAVDSITLGSQGVNTLEMADAYATLAANGVQRKSIAITKIIASDGSVLAEHIDEPAQALTPEVSYAATQVLKTVFGSGGTAAGAQLPSGQVAAGKTGTSENWRDHWLCGYTPQLSTAVWIGARIERETPQWLDCTNVWRDFMSAALEGTTLEDFPSAAAPPYNNPFNKTQPKTESKPKPQAPQEQQPQTPPAAPSVVGMDIASATAALAGYAADYVEVYSSTVAAGVVISQSTEGNTVHLVVSKGPEPAPDPPPPPPPPPPHPPPNAPGTPPGVPTAPPPTTARPTP
ncbi:MAG: penicillin-binding protein [Eggerthellaceae bacterium]